jgi:16S rRNA (cytidine1402-2'-O)-methyltransferase
VSGTLYVVATPIGNLEDITLRAIRTLKEVDLVACEDTRHTRKLLAHFGIATPSVSYHDHNARERAPELLERLERGESVALVSDAGTPAISDPGYRLISGAAERGIPVVPVPGPSAVVAALSASGLATDAFLFAGFLPARAEARRARLADLAAERATVILYEAPHRVAETLADLVDVFGDRPAALARELTKVHEEVVRGRLSEIAAALAPERRRGEMVLVVAGAPERTAAAADSPVASRVAELEAAGLSRMDAIKQAARERGVPKREVYRALSGEG